MERSRFLLAKKRDWLMSLSSGFCNTEWSDANHLYHTNAIIISGILYKPGKNTLLHFANTGEHLPELGRLVNIWQVLDLGTFFVMQPMETVAFDFECCHY